MEKHKNELKKIYDYFVENELINIPDDLKQIEKVKLVRKYSESLLKMQNLINEKLSEAKIDENDKDFKELVGYGKNLIIEFHDKYGYEIK